MNSNEQLMKSIYNIDTKFKNIKYIDNKTFSYKGYLVNLNVYEEFKNKKLSGINNNRKLHQIQFKTASYLVNMILNGNKYIIISPEIWNKFLPTEKENESPIDYSKNIAHIFIKFIDGRDLKFSNYNKDNILDINSYYKSDNNNYISNYDEIEKIYKNIIIYDNYEKNFSNDLKNSSKKSCYGYFVDNSWLNEWNNYSNYYNIKNNFLKTKIDKKIIIDNIIFHREKYKNIQLNPIKLIDFRKKEELIDYLKNNSLVLLENTLVTSFDKTHLDNKKFKFNLYNNMIEFESNNEIFLKVPSNNNIILLNKNLQNNINNNTNFTSNTNDLFNLKLLTKLYYFQKDFTNRINSPHKQIPNDKNVNSGIFLLSKNILVKYKKHFKYNTLRESLIKYDINYNSFESYYLNIVNLIQQSQREYFNNFNNYEKTFLSNFNLNENGSNFNIIKYNGNLKLFFAEDFEFVNEDIFSFFTRNTNIKNNEQIIECYYVGGDGLIFLIFSYKNQNCYEIGTIDKISGNFIIVYLIKDAHQSYKDKIFANFKQFGINNIIQNIFLRANNNEIIFGNDKVGYFYNMQKQNQRDIKGSLRASITSKNSENNESILNIFSFLLSLFSFENELKNEIIGHKINNNIPNNSSSIKPFPLDECYLINRTTFLNIKNYISYQEFAKIINKYELKSSPINDNFINIMKTQNYYKLISNKKIDLNDKELFNLETAHFIDNNNGTNFVHYPINFTILNKDLFHNLIKILNLDESYMNLDVFLYTFKQGKILIRTSLNNILNQKNSKNPYLIYIYSLTVDHNGFSLNYIPEIILYFNKIEDLVNNFERIVKEENIMNLLKQNNFNNFEKKYSCICHLINKNILRRQLTNKSNNSNIKDEKEKMVNKSLSFIINLYKEYTALNQLINKLNNNYNISRINHSGIYPSNNEFYLIDAKYSKELESSLCLHEIFNILNKKEVLDINLIKDNNINNEILGKIKSKLTQNTLNVLLDISKEKLQYKLSNIDNLQPSYITVNGHNRCYFSNCKIINKSIVNLLIKIDNKINHKIKNINCIFDKGKIIIKIDEKIINIGNLTNNGEFIVEYIIQTFYDINIILIKHIFDNEFTKYGYKYIEHFNSFGYKRYTFNNKEIQVKIHKLSEINSTSDDIYISEKLKALILLSVCKLKENNNNNNLKKDEIIEKVVLINIPWLLNYKYEQINPLIKNNKEIIKFLNNYDYPYIQEALDFIISKIEKQTIKQIDESISKANSSIPFHPQPDYIKLHNKKIIKIYNNFLITNEEIYKNILYKNFQIVNNTTKICYLHKNGDVIYISDNNQNTIIFGKIDMSFNIDYIFEYIDKKYIKNELAEIKSFGEEKYIKNKTVFSKKDIIDLISPIFSGNNIIGYCYKYSPTIDYSQCFNYLNYLNNEKYNEKIVKAMKLYKINKEILEKIRENNYFQKEKLFLINKKLAMQIKKDYNYVEFKKKFDEYFSYQNAKKENIYYINK